MKVDFYLLSETSPEARLQFACRLIEKAYQRKHQLYAHMTDRAGAEALDQLLWTYKDDSFIPHNLVGEGPDKPPPVQIGYEEPPVAFRDLLLNFNDTIPEFFQQFKRVMEVIPNDETQKELGRNRYKKYRATGANITMHQM